MSEKLKKLMADLDNAVARVKVGASAESTPECEYYEGIFFDALDELRACADALEES